MQCVCGRSLTKSTTTCVKVTKRKILQTRLRMPHQLFSFHVFQAQCGMDSCNANRSRHVWLGPTGVSPVRQMFRLTSNMDKLVPQGYYPAKPLHQALDQTDVSWVSLTLFGANDAFIVDNIGVEFCNKPQVRDAEADFRTKMQELALSDTHGISHGD